MGSCGPADLIPCGKDQSLTNVADAGERILVSVRMRPLNEKEIAKNDVCDWECIDDQTIMFRNNLPERALFPIAYSFDKVFLSSCSTKQVYEDAAKNVILSVVSGINASIFAYGQTSSGKTFTMSGITEHSITDIYDYIEKHQERAFVLKFSAIEIYNEAVRDLLSSDGTPLRLLDDPEKGTVVDKLTEETLRDRDHLRGLLSICEAQRQIGETSLNEASSRSHQILRLTVESSAREFLGKDNSSTLTASVDFVDLAGSERASQSLSAGSRLKEGCHINRSLLTLGTVIRKLSKGRNSHIPYRDSKLTRILQSSLGGNARTAIICTMSPARSHVEQSRNTLVFASCAKQVTTNAHVNIVMSDRALVKHLQRELARLENELKNPGSTTGTGSEIMLREKNAQIEKLEKEIKELAQQRDLAQSRLENLLQLLEIKQGCGTLGHMDDQHEVKNISSLSSSISPADCSLDFAFDNDQATNVICEEDYLSVNETSNEHNKELHDFSSAKADPMFNDLGLEEYINRADNDHNDSEDQCKDVQCIGEISRGNSTKMPKFLSPEECDDMLSWHMQIEIPRGENEEVVTGQNDAFRKQSENAEKEFDDPIQPLQNGSDRWTCPNLSKCASCNLPSKNQTLSRQNSCRSGESNSTEAESDTMKPRGEESFTSMRGFLSKLRIVADTQYNKQNPVASLNNWPIEFKKQQKEILGFWDVCNVSLVHRTYFFLLFKGDPADSIYVEVELRRLAFLKDAFNRGTDVKSDGQMTTPGSSARELRREREMLSRQMQKRLTAAERESLYQQWGIEVDTKQRRMQLARKIWTDVNDIDHIRESANLVAKLIGFLEPGEALKEMFGLHFSPQKAQKRSTGWKRLAWG